MEQVRGYKAFNKNWTCRGKQYEVGKMFEEDVELEVGAKGMHFCKRLRDCFNYYALDESVTKVAEVLAVGDCLEKDELTVTNKLVVLRELGWDEVINLCNTGTGTQLIIQTDASTRQRKPFGCSTSQVICQWEIGWYRMQELF